MLDASVALKWHLRDENHTAEADSLYDSFVTGHIELTAPHYIRYEVANGLEMARVQGRLGSGEVVTELSSFLDLGLGLDQDTDELLYGALELSQRYTITPYDGLYLALAEHAGLSFVTADGRLYRRIHGAVSYARWIGDVTVSS